MNIFNWFKKNNSKEIQTKKSSLQLEIEDLELYLGIFHYYDKYTFLYESEKYLEKLKELKKVIYHLSNKFSDIKIFLQDPLYIINLDGVCYDKGSNYFLIDFEELEKEITKDNNSRNIILEDLKKLRNREIRYEDINFDIIKYINIDFSCHLSSIISKLIEKRIKLPDYKDLKYSQFYINNYKMEELDKFPRSGPIWKNL